MAKKKSPTVAEANRAYFIVLANTRGSLANLALLAILIFFVVGIAIVGPLRASNFPGFEVFTRLANANLVIIWIAAILWILTFLKKLIYRFQVFSSAVMTVMAVGLLYGMCLMAVTMAAIPPTGDKHLFEVLFKSFVAVAAVLVAGATVVNVLLLRRRLRVGHSEARTVGNIVAVSGGNREKIFWITLAAVAAVAAVPNVLTHGQYLQNTIGVLGLLLFACVMPSLPLEYAYLAYLKSKDRDYWEAPSTPRSKQERLRIAKKSGLWVSGIAATLAVLWALAKYVPLWLA